MRKENIPHPEGIHEVKLEAEMEEEEFEKTNHSKEFLKFSRKLANLVSDHLQKKTDVLIKILEFSARITEYFFLLFGMSHPNLSELVSLQVYCLERQWNNFKEIISYSKNKKICIVKSDDWNKLYDKTVFAEAIKLVLEESDAEFHTINPKLMAKLEAVLVPFTRVLFYANLIFSFTMIMKDSSIKGEYLRNLKTIENFLVMMVSPDLYKNYNHRSGKFALECCGKCKVCRSKNVAPSFTLQLERGRAKSELMKTFILYTLIDLRDVSDEKILSFFNLVANYI